MANLLTASKTRPDHVGFHTKIEWKRVTRITQKRVTEEAVKQHKQSSLNLSMKVQNIKHVL